MAVWLLEEETIPLLCDSYAKPLDVALSYLGKDSTSGFLYKHKSISH